MVPCVGEDGDTINGVNLITVPIVVLPVTVTLPADTLPTVDTLPALIKPVTDKLVDVVVVAVSVLVESEVSPVMVGDRLSVTPPLEPLADRLASVPMLVTPEFVIVIVPEAKEFDNPSPVAILAVVNDEASVNTFTKLSCILPKAVYRLSLPVGLLGAPMLIIS